MSDSTATTAGAVIGYDAIRVNIASLPPDAPAYAGYATGAGIVPWTQAQFDAHATSLGPCLRVDQDPAASDPTADYLDVENGAATPADGPGWVKRAAAARAAVRRRGQRPPAIYMNASTVTSVVNALIDGGVKSGAGLIIADWSLTEAQALADVLAAAGPFPVVGIQCADSGPYDVNIFSRAWLLDQAGGAVTPPAPAEVFVSVSARLPILKQGDKDAAGKPFYVRRAQNAIKGISEWNSLGISLTVTGTFDMPTEVAVKRVQKLFGLRQDGVIGQATWGAFIGG
jgi:hypothetical protein